MSGRKGFGGILEYDSTGGGVWVVIANVTKIRPFAKKCDVIDTTSMSSASETREKLGGLIDEGECAFDLNYDESDATHIWLKANVQVTQAFRYTAPVKGVAAAKKVTFSGFVSHVPPDVPMDNKMTCSPVITISGPVTAFA